MHEHDHDLIMALAEGTLDAGAAAAAEAELAGCERCSDELTLQRASLAATAAAPRAWLTEIESTRLRRALRTELDLVTAPAPAPRRRFLPVAVLGGAAAVLLAVVLALPALENLGGRDDDAVAFATTTTTATAGTAEALTAAPTAPAADAPAVAEAPAEDAAAGVDEAAGRAQSATTTAGAATTTAPEGTIILSLTVADETGLEAIRETWIAEGGDPALTFFALESEFESTIETADRYAACGDAGIATVPEALDYVTLGVGDFEGEEAVFLGYLTDPIDDGVVIAHELDTCDVLATAP